MIRHLTQSEPCELLAGRQALPPVNDFGRNRYRAITALLLAVIPCTLYVILVSRWSLDLDEIYTLWDSQQSWRTILAYEKPLYYLACHVLLQNGVPVELALRLPAALSAGLVPCAFYLLLGRQQQCEALIAAGLVAAHPWLLEFSQFGRFYATLWLLSSIAVLSLYRYLPSGQTRWLFAFLGSATLATLTHTTALVLFPAGLLASWLGRARIAATTNGAFAVPPLLERGRMLGLLLLVAASCLVLSGYFGMRVLLPWLEAQHGQFGNYSTLSLIAGFVAFVGLQIWALALLPLIKPWREWQGEDVFLVCILGGASIPFLFLSPWGGGIAPRYLVAATPCLFLLAARHGRVLWDHLPQQRYRLALAAVVLALYAPAAASTLRDGNHCDYRQATAFVESLQLPDPIVACTAHGLFAHYATQPVELHELRTLHELAVPPAADGNEVYQRLLHLITRARQTGRPLILVAREDRRLLPAEVQRWLHARFAVLATLERPRFDHRRNQMVIYELRSQ